MIGRYLFKSERKDPINMRTVFSIEDALIRNISDVQQISGEHCALMGVIRLVREQRKNPEFAAALKLVAETVLGLFPNQE